MALRQGGRALARGLAQARGLPQRGGGGGPIKYAAPQEKPVPLWDELWWHDGLLHSQPVLDGTLEPQLQSPGTTLRQLAIVLTGLAGSIWAMNASWSERKDVYVPSQYPPEVLKTYTDRGKVEWARPPLRELPAKQA
ncbi:hypothetical protein HT031_006358 [Scenedesmus sp. PABB004]|nr:hypothetical protein HT031_006358 [Scenedesmus sp. PABB004]